MSRTAVIDAATGHRERPARPRVEHEPIPFRTVVGWNCARCSTPARGSG